MKELGKGLTLGGLVLAVLCVCGLLLLQYLAYDDDWQEYYELGAKDYIYDPQTILSESDVGRGLKEVSALPTPNPSAEPVMWEQSDFLLLALALVHSDLDGEWFLVGADFGMPCDAVAAGPQRMNFSFEKFVQTESGRGRGSLHVYIDPQNERAGWGGSVDVNTWGLYPHPNRPELDPEELIDVRAALRVAEEKGGHAFREGFLESANGQCRVSGYLSHGSKRLWGWQPAAWRIRYGSRSYTPDMPEWTICLDAQSGEVIDCGD